MVYFDGPTETDTINQLVKDSTDIQNEKLIRKFIEEHDTSEMEAGVNYYFNNSDIRRRLKYYYDGAGVPAVDETKPNNKIPHGFAKLLVDQKVAYVAGKPVTFDGDDEQHVEVLNEMLGEDFDDALNELVKGASNKGVEYLHPYIDEQGEFQYIVTPAEQIIPLYESNKQRKLEYVIRYYPWFVNDKETIRAEWWDKNTVTYYIKGDDGYKPDPTEEENQPHFQYGEDGYGWGEVPFIEFKNNEEKKPDLTWVKDEIDDYDKVKSDTSNNFDEIQAFIYVLKNYDGADLKEFMHNLRYFKAIKTDSDGGVDKLVSELPIDSIDSHLDRTEGNIYRFGQGVDLSTDKFGANPSGVALKFLFSNLDMKSNTLILKFKKALERFVWFATEYLIMSNQLPDSADYKNVKFVFNKSMIINELEQAQIAMNSQGVISKKTIVANHPWVTDVEQEMTDLEKEQEDEYKRMDEQLGKVGEEDGNTGTGRQVPGQSN